MTHTLNYGGHICCWMAPSPVLGLHQASPGEAAVFKQGARSHRPRVCRGWGLTAPRGSGGWGADGAIAALGHFGFILRREGHPPAPGVSCCLPLHGAQARPTVAAGPRAGPREAERACPCPWCSPGPGWHAAERTGQGAARFPSRFHWRHAPHLAPPVPSSGSPAPLQPVPSPLFPPPVRSLLPPPLSIQSPVPAPRAPLSPRSPSGDRSVQCTLHRLQGRGRFPTKLFAVLCSPFSRTRWIHSHGPGDRPASSFPCRCFYLRGLQAASALGPGQVPL